MVLDRKKLTALIGYITLCCLACDVTQAQSDANSPYIPSIIPPSPNAATLTKFSDVPVSPYTGATDITVPIYSIQAKGITVPIGLSYHTGGIRVKEEAGWVGLGWALNAGGMISRTVMGSDDFGTQGFVYLTNQVPQLPGDISSSQPVQSSGLNQISPYRFDFWCSDLVNTSAGTEDLSPALGAGGSQYDMEPDIFNYNFPGHSGKFILTRAGRVVMQKQENIRIQFVGTGGQVTFVVTDEQGNTFYFNDLEQTAVPLHQPMTSSWLLSRIVTQQQDVVTFSYVDGGSTISMADEIHNMYGQYCTAVASWPASTNAPSPFYYNKTLHSIDFANGEIHFGFDANRIDLQGSYKLDSVTLYSKNAAGALTYVKQHNLYYSYFNGAWPQLGPTENYRLRLDSVKEVSGAISVPPYSFVYNNPDPGAGLAKHGFNVDHWGFYNGMSNTTFIPTMELGYNPLVNEIGFSQVLNYSGASRQAVFPAMQTFSLQQVTYPTGGKTVLTYAANDYDYMNSVQNADHTFSYVQTVPMSIPLTIRKRGTSTGVLDLSRIYPVVTAPNTNFTVTVAFRYLQNNTFPYSNTTGKIWFSIQGDFFDINSATCQAGGPVCTSGLSITMNPGKYTWTAYIDSTGVVDTVNTFADIDVGFHYTETQQQNNLFQNSSAITLAGGLRVQSVTDYTDANTIASQRVFNYGYLQPQGGSAPIQRSYGRLMSMPSYARYDITNTGQGGYCTALVLYGSSINSLTSAIQGNVVGYDQVTESRVDPVTGQDIGKTVYTYFNSPDTAIQFSGYSIPGLLNMGNNLNGLLLSKVDYAAVLGQYAKVAETNNFYRTANRTVYYSPKYQYYPQTGSCPSGGGGVRQAAAWFYPSIKSEKVLLDSSRNILFKQGDATKSITTHTGNFYDNPAHYQLTRTRTFDSKGNTLVSSIKYPQDYIPSGNTSTGNSILDAMIGRNMVSEVIEKADSLYHPSANSGTVTGAQLHLYRSLSNSGNPIVPDRVYQLDVPAAVSDFQPFSVNGNTVNQDSRYEQKVSFDGYDGNSNIAQFTPTDLTPQSFIWDYSGTLPIARIVNATVDQVAYTSFEADGNGGWTIPSATDPSTAMTGNRSYNLGNGAISHSGLNSSSPYVVAYWSKAGSYSVSGTTSILRGKTVNGWTYYEHKVTGVTTVQVSGNSNIDELRLYPANAQMTTFTYTPLIGMNSQCDPAGRVTYFEYDGLGRLKVARDQDGNIVKTYDYHYKGQP